MSGKRTRENEPLAAEQGLYICVNKEFFPSQGSSVPTDGERSLISNAKKKRGEAVQLESIMEPISFLGIGVVEWESYTLPKVFHKPLLRTAVGAPDRTTGN